MTEKEFSQTIRRGLGGSIVELQNSENKAAYGKTETYGGVY